MSFLEELKRRNIFRVAVAYLIVAWLLIQVGATLEPAMHLPDWVDSVLAFFLLLGFPVAMFFAWAYELTPQGLKRDVPVNTDESVHSSTGRQLDRVIIVVLVLAVGYFLLERYMTSPAVVETTGEETHQLDIDSQQVTGDTTLQSELPLKSIAVLPFVNMSSDPEQEYFSDGISEELINLLAKIPELRVISRSSAFSYKGKEIKLKEVARELNVGHILEGSVRKAGNRVRITAQLIDAHTDIHLWSETYDRTLDDIFAVQDEVAAAVVRHLHLALIGEPPRTKHINPQAYTLFLQARQIVFLSQDENLPRAEALLKQALVIDPDYVDALILLFDVTSDEALAAEAFEKADALDPDNAKIKAMMAVEYFNQAKNLEEKAHFLSDAARLLEGAAAIDPYEPLVLFNSARLADSLGKKELATRLGEYIAMRDPLYFWAQLNLASNYFVTGRIEEAVAQFEIALSLNSTKGAVQWKYGLAKLVAGEPEGALKAFQEEKGFIYRTHGLALAYHDLGREAESAAAIQTLLLTEVEVWPWGLARAYAWIGDADQAFFYLNVSVENGPITPGLELHPLFHKLHTDSRWLPFLRSVEQKFEQLAAIEFSVQVPR